MHAAAWRLAEADGAEAEAQMTSLLPFQQSDLVSWRGEAGFILEMRGGRIVVETVDGVLHITTAATLRAMQPVRGAA